jgi:hypothetical protein
MNIQIKKAPEELSEFDQLAKVLYDFFNFNTNPDILITGIFSTPYQDESRTYAPEEMQQFEYFYDRVEQVNGETTPLIFAWRKWGFKANEFMAAMKKHGYSIKKD